MSYFHKKKLIHLSQKKETMNFNMHHHHHLTNHLR